MKKLVKGVAAALAVTMLAGCGASASSSTTEQASSSQATAQTPTADGKSVIRVGIGSDPASFGPFEAGGNGKKRLVIHGLHVAALACRHCLAIPVKVGKLRRG